MKTVIFASILAAALASTAAAHDLADIIQGAESGNVEAQYILGGMYEIGLGVARNDDQCAHWWQEAANQGHAGSQKALGSMYFSGRGVPQDYAKSMHWYLMAAEQGHPHAQKYVALGYQRGMGLPVDPEKAAYWKAEAAKQSGPETSVAFLEAYQQEETELHSDQRCFRRISAPGRERHDARIFLCRCSLYGRARARRRTTPQLKSGYRKAAELELHAGMEALGIFYQLGQGVRTRPGRGADLVLHHRRTLTEVRGLPNGRQREIHERGRIIRGTRTRGTHTSPTEQINVTSTR